MAKDQSWALNGRNGSLLSSEWWRWINPRSDWWRGNLPGEFLPCHPTKSPSPEWKRGRNASLMQVWQRTQSLIQKLGYGTLRLTYKNVESNIFQVSHSKYDWLRHNVAIIIMRHSEKSCMNMDTLDKILKGSTHACM